MIYLLKIVIFVNFLVCKPLNKRWKGSVTKGPSWAHGEPGWRSKCPRSNGELRHQLSRSCPYHVVTGGVHLTLQRRYSRVSIELPLLFQCRLMAVHGPIVMSVTAPLKDGPTQHACGWQSKGRWELVPHEAAGNRTSNAGFSHFHHPPIIGVPINS